MGPPMEAATGENFEAGDPTPRQDADPESILYRGGSIEVENQSSGTLPIDVEVERKTDKGDE